MAVRLLTRPWRQSRFHVLLLVCVGVLLESRRRPSASFLPLARWPSGFFPPPPRRRWGFPRFPQGLESVSGGTGYDVAVCTITLIMVNYAEVQYPPSPPLIRARINNGDGGGYWTSATK